MFETIEVTSTQVCCDGGAAFGHPKVYLHLREADGNTVTCPYCSRRFVLAAGTTAAAHPHAA